MGSRPFAACRFRCGKTPTRMNHDDRYFTDTFQKMPAAGYTRLFDRMLNGSSIDVKLGVDFFKTKRDYRPSHIVYTGPVDAFYSYCYGALPYRSIRFEHEHIDGSGQYQQVGTVNYPNDHDYTRITEFKHLTGQTCRGTSIVREYPQAEGDPYYPIPRVENEQLFKRYEALAKAETNVTFVGRLAQYRYYNMDQCVGAALKASQYVLEKLGVTRHEVATERLTGTVPA